jgi:hypothetical protein
MSKKLLSFFLKELKIIRIHCSSSMCGGVVEFPTEQLHKLKRTDSACPVCGAGLNLDKACLIGLGQHFEQLSKNGSQIEFVLPDTTDQKPSE